MDLRLAVLSILALLAGTIALQNPSTIAEAGSDTIGLNPSISEDRRFVAFSSSQAVTPSDTNSHGDVFVHDEDSDVTELVSVASNGEPADGGSDYPTISGNGRFVVFRSRASNLDPRDTLSGPSDCYGLVPSCPDIFVHDRNTGTTEMVSVAADGTPPDGESYGGSISDDGTTIVFLSGATNIAPQPSPSPCRFDFCNLYLHDSEAGTTVLLPYLAITAAISGNGEFIAMTVQDKNCDCAFVAVLTIQTGDLAVVSTNLDGHPALGVDPSVSDDGLHVAFFSRAPDIVTGDTNGQEDVFVHHLDTGVTKLVSLRPEGTQFGRACPRHVTAPPPCTAISNDGRFVAFVAEWQAYVRDTEANITYIVSTGENGEPGDGNTPEVEISEDGGTVVFGSIASNLRTHAKLCETCQGVYSVDNPGTTDVLGDANCDRLINSDDVIAALLNLGNRDNAVGCARNADFNGDGEISALDALAIVTSWAAIDSASTPDARDIAPSHRYPCQSTA